MNELTNECNRCVSPVERKTLGHRSSSLVSKYPTWFHSWVHICLQILLLSWSRSLGSLLGPKTVRKGFPTWLWSYHSMAMKSTATHRIDAGINSCLSVTTAVLTSNLLNFFSSTSIESVIASPRGHQLGNQLFWSEFPDSSNRVLWKSFYYPGNHHEQIIIVLILLK